MASIIRESVLLAFIFVAALFDFKRHSLPWSLLAAGGAAGIILRVLTGEPSVTGILAGTGTGLTLVLISLLSKGSLGAGDGLAFAVSGIFLGLSENIFLLLFSALAAGITSLFLIVFKKYGRRSRIPFMPFMLFGYICLLAFSGTAGSGI